MTSAWLIICDKIRTLWWAWIGWAGSPYIYAGHPYTQSPDIGTIGALCILRHNLYTSINRELWQQLSLLTKTWETDEKSKHFQTYQNTSKNRRATKLPITPRKLNRPSTSQRVLHCKYLYRANLEWQRSSGSNHDLQVSIQQHFASLQTLLTRKLQARETSSNSIFRIRVPVACFLIIPL
jgi:hypothetical protein